MVCELALSRLKFCNLAKFPFFLTRKAIFGGKVRAEEHEAKLDIFCHIMIDWRMCKIYIYIYIIQKHIQSVYSAP